jgi:hypothetical protein
MSATEIAKLHFAAAIEEAKAAGLDQDSLCRSLLGLVVSKYLENRNVSDVQSELRFVADSCDLGLISFSCAPKASYFGESVLCRCAEASARLRTSHSDSHGSY